MRAVCPSCEAAYEVPDRLIGAGRRLRCANCGHQWTLLLPAAAEKPAPPREAGPPPAPPPPGPASATAAAPRAEPPPAAPAAAAPPPPPPPPPAHRMLRRAPQVIDPPLPPVDDTTGRRAHGDWALRAAWIGSVLLVALALAALWAFRHEIAEAWPPAARLVGTPTGGG